MPELVIENDDAPVGDKRLFYLKFEDKKDKQQVIDYLDDFIESAGDDPEPFKLQESLSGDYALSVLIPDDEVGEVTDLLGRGMAFYRRHDGRFPRTRT